jgi:hypothetical protein
MVTHADSAQADRLMKYVKNTSYVYMWTQLYAVESIGHSVR